MIRAAAGLAGLAAASLAGCRDTWSNHNPYAVNTIEWARDEARRCSSAAADGTIGSLPDRDCQELGQPHFLSGIWLNDFEGSQFVEGARSAAQARGVFERWGRGKRVTKVWLTVDGRTKGIKPPALPDGAAYKIEMLGRTSPTRHGPLGGYGHMGAFDGLVVADFVLALKRLD